MNGVSAEWVHVAYRENSAMREVYGFQGTQGFVNLEGILFKPDKIPSRTLPRETAPATAT